MVARYWITHGVIRLCVCVCVCVYLQIQFCYRNPSTVEATDDFLTLPHLDEPNILHSLRVRYQQGHVYSYTGPILIAVNPWRQVG